MALFNFLKPKRTARVVPHRKPLLMHPDFAPRTMTILPSDIRDYRYVGPTVEMVLYKDMRRPAFVARMMREHRSPTDTLVQEEMTASVRDLKDGEHAEAEEIAEALRSYYQKYVPPEQQEKARGLLRKTIPAAKKLKTDEYESLGKASAAARASSLSKLGTSV